MYQCNLMRNYAKLCETMRNYAKLRETKRNYAKLCETMRNYARLCETMKMGRPIPSKCVSQLALAMAFANL